MACICQPRRLIHPLLQPWRLPPPMIPPSERAHLRTRHGQLQLQSSACPCGGCPPYQRQKRKQPHPPISSLPHRSSRNPHHMAFHNQPNRAQPSIFCACNVVSCIPCLHRLGQGAGTAASAALPAARHHLMQPSVAACLVRLCQRFLCVPRFPPLLGLPTPMAPQWAGALGPPGRPCPAFLPTQRGAPCALEICLLRPH